MISCAKRNRLIVYSVMFVASAVFILTQQSLRTDAQSTTPPKISDIKIVRVGATSTVVDWSTDVAADSVVNFGTTKIVGIFKDPNPSVIQHEMILTDLLPATTYYFRVQSADSSGNRTFSPTFRFTTTSTIQLPGLNQVPSQAEQQLTQQAAEIVKNVKNEQALQIILKQVEKQGEAELTPPRIIGDPHLDIGTDQVTVSWQTDKESNSVVNFASEGEYHGSYVRSEGSDDSFSLSHVVTLHGLKPSVVYHYQITSKPRVGPEAATEDKTFTTKSILPQIFGIHLEKVEQDSATLVWSTQVPAGGLVEYTNMSTKENKSIGDPSEQLTHTVRLPDLKFRTLYSAIIKARTKSGDEITSQPITFTTTKDDTPPIIANVSNESTLYPGADVKVQTIVAWDTDEPASCQFFYGEGLTVTDENKVSLPEETGFILKHTQVITAFTPSTVYKFWVECRDRNDNLSKSEDFVLFTPEKEKSILDIILENFQGTFGWVKNIGK